MRIKKPSPTQSKELLEEILKKKKLHKKRTSLRRVELVLFLASKRPTEKDRKKLDDLILELIAIPDCVRCTSIFTLKLTTMCSCNPKWEREPTQEELVKIDNELNYLSVA